MIDVPVICWSKDKLVALEIELSRRITTNINSNHKSQFVVVGIHGIGIIDGNWVSTKQEAQDYFHQLAEFNPDLVGSSIRGSLTIYLWDTLKSELFVLADPLGGGLVFIYDSDHSVFVSTSITSLVDEAANNGIRIPKSLSYTASYVGTGSGGLVESSYIGVRRLQQFTYLKITNNGIAEHYYGVRDYVYDSDFKYEDLMTRVIDEIGLNIKVSLEHKNHSRIAHLTGGIDSRLVLGSIVSLNLQDKFRFYCSGNENEPDQRTAMGLSSTLDLEMTKHSGIEAVRLADGLRDQLLNPLAETGGIVGGPASSNLRQGNRLILSGGYGELLRSFYSKGYRFDGDVRAAATKIFGSGSFHANPKLSLLSTSAISDTVGGMERLLAYGKRLGLNDSGLLDSLYFTARNRYFVGEISRSVSPYAARFDPLYSLSLARLGLHADVNLKTNGVVGLDLLRTFSEELIGLPFDSERITPTYERLRSPVVRIPMSDTPPRYDGSKVPPVAVRPHITPSRPSMRDVETANALKTSPRLVAQNSEVRARLSELLSRISDAELSEGFNPMVIRKLIKSEPTHRVHLRTVMKLYASLEWYFAD